MITLHDMIPVTHYRVKYVIENINALLVFNNYIRSTYTYFAISPRRSSEISTAMKFVTRTTGMLPFLSVFPVPPPPGPTIGQWVSHLSLIAKSTRWAEETKCHLPECLVLPPELSIFHQSGL